MIGVIGSIYLSGDGPEATPGGLAGRVAAAAAAAGAAVEIVAKVGDDPPGDALLLALARSGVGHVAVLRDPIHPTALRRTFDDAGPDWVEDADAGVVWAVEPADAPALEVADVGLAMRYLTELGVAVAVHLSTAILVEVATAADWAGAHLVVVTRPGDTVATVLPPGSLILEAGDDPVEDSAIGARLGEYAAAVDAGTAAVTAYAALTAEPA